MSDFSSPHLVRLCREIFSNGIRPTRNDQPRALTCALHAGHIIWHLALLLLGIMLGLLLANRTTWFGEPSDHSNAVEREIAPAPKHSSIPSIPGVSTKFEEVTLSSSLVRLVPITRLTLHEKSTTSGIVLPGNSGLVMRLSALLDAQSLEFEDTVIRFNELAVAAINGLHDLALLNIDAKTPMLDTSNQQYGNLAPDELSVLLGRQYIMATFTERVAVEINEKLSTFYDGTSGYSVSAQGTPTSPLMPIFALEHDTLVGLAMPLEDSPLRLKLLDRDILEGMISDAKKLPASSIALLQQDFFENTPLGKLRQFEAHQLAENFEGMLNSGEQYLATGSLIKRERIIETLHSLIAQKLDSLYRSNNLLEADQLFNQASFFLPRHPGIELAYFQTQLAQSNPAVALDAAQHWLEGNKSIDRTKWLELHFNAVFSTLDAAASTGDKANQLLTRAIRLDPSQADYFVARAKLFEFDENYAETIADLKQAIHLDALLANDLNREIDKLQRRLDTPGTLRVPVTNSGGILATEVSVNGVILNFVIDTGASRTAISASAVAYLGLASKAFGSVRIATANGLAYGRNLKVDELSVADAVVRNLDAVVVESVGNHDGLLGLDFLGGYQLEINTAAGEIVLTPR